MELETLELRNAPSGFDPSQLVSQVPSIVATIQADYQQFQAINQSLIQNFGAIYRAVAPGLAASNPNAAVNFAGSYFNMQVAQAEVQAADTLFVAFGENIGAIAASPQLQALFMNASEALVARAGF